MRSPARHALTVLRCGLAAVSLLAISTLAAIAQGVSHLAGPGQLPIEEAATIRARNIAVPRTAAARMPHGEREQAVVNGWPLYRTERGQVAFNDAMATLKATEGRLPTPAAFKGCQGLECPLLLPPAGVDGWLPAGRLWLSPTSYLLIVHSPRQRPGQSWRRNPPTRMRYFVLHEFHNSTRNTDLYDTISSHSSFVFVPLYMGKQEMDATGRRFVVVVQVAPYDVQSVHATNLGSAGPGIEVAKGPNEPLEPLQAEAGIAIATMIKAAAPGLQVINHRGSEGRPMLDAYERRLALLRNRPSSPAVALPFVPADPQRIAAAAGRLEALVWRRGGSPPVPAVPAAPLRAETAPPPPSGTARAAAPASTAQSSPPRLLGPPVRLARRPEPPAEPLLVETTRPAMRQPATLEPRGTR